MALLEGVDGLTDESLIDTLADLGTYAAKYITFLADNYPEMTAQFVQRYRPNTRIEDYQGNEGFDAVGIVLNRRHTTDNKRFEKFDTQALCFKEIQEIYTNLEELLLRGEWSVANPQKCELAADLSILAIQYLLLSAHDSSREFAAFARSIEKL